MKIKKEIGILASLILIGQLAFLIMSPNFLTPQYSGEAFGTMGVKHEQEDLHKLNEAAHFFGQTIIGWMKFPHFMEELNQATKIPEGTQASAALQERQNIILRLEGPKPIEKEMLIGLKEHIQKKINDYNEVSQTNFILTNLDYQTNTHQRSYSFGAVISLIITIVLWMGIYFVRKEWEL